MNQQKIMQAQMIEQEINNLNHQFQLIEQTLKELEEILTSINEIQKDKTKDILVNIGKGIYLPVEIKEKKLIVEVGNKNFVKKNVEETKEIIQDQTQKLLNAKNQVQDRIESLYSEINDLLRDYEEELKKSEEINKKNK